MSCVADCLSCLCSRVHKWRSCLCLHLFIQESIVKDVREGEKSSKQLKGHLKDVLQACSGLQPKHSVRDRRESSETDGLQASRMSDGMLARMTD